MAKVTGQSSDLSGKVGNITYMQTKYGTVAFPSKKKAKVPRRSERQMEIRTQWVNLGAVYRQFHQTLKKAFEDVGQMSAYNAFVQANINVVKVYISKQERLNGGSVLAPYLITRGSLDSIYWETNPNNVLVTSINLGELVIDAETTVGALSQAIIAGNMDWKNGDQLSFFYGVQTIDAVTSVPRARIQGYKLVLNVTSTQKVWETVMGSGLTVHGFATVDGFLGMSQAITNGAAAWVHSRENGSNLLVSSQYLYVDSAVLEAYMNGSAFDASVASYGGINTSAVFLDPGQSENPTTYDFLSPSGATDGSTTGGGGSSSTTNDTNPTSGGGTSSNTDNTNPTDEPGGSGGNTGGGTTGGGIEEG